MSDGGAPGNSPGPGGTPGAGASPAASRTAPAAPTRRASDALATGPSAPRERGWWRLIVALLAFLLVPVMPVRAIAPVQQTMILLVAAMAACTLVGWLLGGRLALALIWGVLAVFVAVMPAAPGGAFDRLARGWALVLGASFGLVCLFGRGRALFGRALAAVGLALAAALVATAGGSSLAELRDGVGSEIGARVEEIADRLDASAGWRRLAASVGTAATPGQIVEGVRESTETLTTVAPALLALESLMALALAWSLYHRVSRARLGPPLGRLQEFRFNDQLVWGLIVGLVIVLLPSLAGLREVGMNLVVFFGSLYVLRGLGVVAWFLRRQRGAVVALLCALAVVLWPIMTPFALGLGLGDTWLDWRARGARPTT